jgi:ribosomal protein L40E
MLPTQCAVCDHKNPPDAKFCNECGSPLHLTSCRHCGAVNDRASTHCYSCGAQILVSSMAAEAALVSTVPGATAASKILSDIGVESGRAPLAESAAASLEIPEHRGGNETVGVSEDVIPLVSGALRATDVAPLANVVSTPRPRPTFHAILPAVLVAAVALSAYYVYRYPVQLGDWLSRGPPNLGVPAPADADGTSAPPGPPVDTRTEVAASPTTRGSIRAGGVDGVGGETPTPPEPSRVESTGQPPRSTSQIAAAQPFGNKTARAAGVSSAVTAIAVEPRKKTARTVDDRGASQTVATRSSTSYPATAAVEAELPRQADSRVNVRPDTQRLSACTEAVAALGLCNPGTRGESK